MDRSSSFARLSRRLSHRCVVRYDRRGYGRSVALGPPGSFAAQIADLRDVIGDEPAVVVGHSYGGTVALGTAAAHPDAVCGIVLYESPIPWQPWWPTRSAGAAAAADGTSPEDAAELFMQRVVGEDRWRRLPPSTRAARRAEGPTMVAELRHLRSDDPPFALGDVTVPVLAGHGTEGAAHHARAARTVAEGVAQGRGFVVDGAGHGVHLSHPGVLADHVDAFVDELITPGGS